MDSTSGSYFWKSHGFRVFPEPGNGLAGLLLHSAGTARGAPHKVLICLVLISLSSLVGLQNGHYQWVTIPRTSAINLQAMDGWKARLAWSRGN